MTKAELLEKCKELNIPANANMSKAELEDLLNNYEVQEDEVQEDEVQEDEVQEDEVQEDVLYLKLARRHPANRMRVGNIVVEGYTFKAYEVNEDIMKELETKGCKHWIAIKED